MPQSLPELEAFIHDFEQCRLSKERWTHAAHLTVGLWYLSRLPFEEALGVVRERIRRHNESVGTANTDENGYHETITRLYLLGIAAHVRRQPEEPLLATLKSLLEAPLTRSDWPLTFYSRERLFSVAARRDWVAPDLAAAPSG